MIIIGRHHVLCFQLAQNHSAYFPDSVNALCEVDFVTSGDDGDDISYTTRCSSNGQFYPERHCIARNYDSAFQKLHDSSRQPVITWTALGTNNIDTWESCEKRALTYEANVFTFQITSGSNGGCKIYDLGLPEDLQLATVISVMSGAANAPDVYARGDVNVAYGKQVIGTVGDQTGIGSIVDGKYTFTECYGISSPDLPWIKVDLGYWYRVTRVHLTMGDLGGSAIVTIKAVGDPEFDVHNNTAIEGHTNCAVNVPVPSLSTRIFQCMSDRSDYVTSRVIALYVAAAATATVCELAVYTEQGNKNVALGKDFYGVSNSALITLVDGIRSDAAQFLSCVKLTPAGPLTEPRVIVDLGEPTTIFKVAITNSVYGGPFRLAPYSDSNFRLAVYAPGTARTSTSGTLLQFISPGLNGVVGTVSVELRTQPGHYLLHYYSLIIADSLQDSRIGGTLFRADATWWLMTGMFYKDTLVLRSYSFPNHYLRLKDNQFILSQYDNSLFTQEASFIIIPDSSAHAAFSVYTDDDTDFTSNKTCYENLEIQAGKRKFNYCNWPNFSRYVIIEWDTSWTDLAICEIEIYEWSESVDGDRFGLDLWKADCPQLRRSLTSINDSTLQKCADSCHDSTMCRGIILKHTLCYHLRPTDDICDYKKSSDITVVGYKINRCEEVTYINVPVIPKQYYGDVAEVACNAGYSFDETNHTDNRRDAHCTIKGFPNSVDDMGNCTAVKCTFGEMEPPNTNGSALVGETIFYPSALVATCALGYVQRPDPPDYGTLYPDTYNISCMANGTFDDPENCKAKPCTMPKPANTTAANHIHGLFSDPAITLGCILGHHVVGDENSETYNTQCEHNGWTVGKDCTPKLCSMPVPENINYASASINYTSAGDVEHDATDLGALVDPDTVNHVLTGDTEHDKGDVDAALEVPGTINQESVIDTPQYPAGADLVLPDSEMVNQASTGDTAHHAIGVDTELQVPDNLNHVSTNVTAYYPAEVTLMCMSGYVVAGTGTERSYTTACGENGQFNLSIPCERIKCPMLFPQNTRNGTEGVYEDEVTVECLEGYITTLEGPEHITADNYTSDLVISNYTSKCEADGHWDKNLTCRRTFCKAPAFANTTQQDDPGTDFIGVYEDIRRVDCKTGYWTINGHLRNYDVECGAQGEWLTNSCVYVQCARLVIANADISPFKPWALYEESVQVTCDHNYETEDSEQGYYTQCGDSGNWTISKECLLKECDEISLSNTNATNHTQAAGSTVLVTCDKGHETEYGATSFEMSCNLNRQWRNVYNCSRVYCRKLNVANTNTWDVEMQFGDTVEVVTSPGYENQFGNNTMSCICGADKEWTPKPIISAVRCSADGPPRTIAPKLESHFPLSTLVKCQVGCSLNDSMTTNYLSHCNASGMWTKLIPCQQIWCPEYSVDGWTLGLPQALWGTGIVRECTEGFEVSGGKRNASCFCGNGGQWNIERCYKVLCPAFIAANVAQSNTTGSYGDTLYIKCPEGHQTVSGLTEYNTTCGDDKVWSMVLSCLSRNCSKYSVPNTTVQNMAGSFGQVKNGSCIAGHTITSTVSTFELRCNASGQWEHPGIVCNRVVCDPFTVPHSEGVRKSQVSGEFGDSSTVRCKPGYSLSGNLKEVITYCSSSGDWNWTGTCNPVTCTKLTYDHSVELVGVLGNTTYGSVYEFRCTSGFSDMTTIGSNGTKCLTDGQWSPTPTCLPVCPTLDIIDNGEVSPKKVQVNTQVRYTCIKGFQLNGNVIRKCVYSPEKRISQWTGTIPKCEVTPIPGFWHPWSDWTRCTSMCNHGTHERERRCEPPLYGGAPCTGLYRQSEVCSEVPCPVDGYIEEWGPWTKCKVTCGLGFQTKTRHCVPALHGGRHCDELKDDHSKKVKLMEIRSCDIPECPLTKYEAVEHLELQGQYKEADNRPMIRIASISIGIIFIGLIICLAVVMDATRFLMKRHDHLQKTALARAKRRIERIPQSVQQNLN